MATNLSCDLDCMLRSFFDSVETRRVGIAGFAVLIWDHLITLDDEIEYVWKSDRKHYFFYLFLLNRYLIPLSFVVNLYAYCSHTFDYNVGSYVSCRASCRNFVAYEGILTMVGIAISNLMMLYRVNALYRGPSAHGRRCHPVVLGLGTLLVVFVCINTWLFFSAQPIFVQSQHVHSCTMIFDPSLPGAVTSSTAWLPLIYDTTVVGLTVYRTLPYGTDHIATTTRRLLREGLLYYSVIFSVTLTLTVMILAAPPGTKNIAAQLELLLTATMMSRITLDLKRFARAGTASDTQGYFRSPAASGHLPVPGPPPVAAPPSLPAPVLHGARDARDAIELVRKEHKVGSMIVDVEEEWIEHSSAAQV